MTQVLTLIGGVGTDDIITDLAAEVLSALVDAGAAARPPDWLKPREACDIYFSGIGSADAAAIAGDQLAKVPIDVAVQSVAGRCKRLLVADMESTIITRELVDEIARLAGLGSQIAEITGRSMRGEIDFAQSLRERVAMLAGLRAELLDQVEELIELMPGARFHQPARV